MTNEVKISRKELERLQDRDYKLSCLEIGGVDNWEWYGESLSGYFKRKELDDLYEGFIEDLNDVLADAEVEYPAGRDAGHSISFNEDFVKNILSKLCSDVKEIEND